MKIGILGGTFDPVHRGHLAIAEAARQSLALAEVYFVPTAQTPLKEGTISAAEHRVQMVLLAIAGQPCFKLSTVEIERSGTSFTVDTLVELSDKLGAGNELYYIIGQDSLSGLPRWKEPDRIVRLCYLVVAPRPGYPPLDRAPLERAIPGLSQRLIVLDSPEIDISATEIRDRVRQGLSIGDLVPAPVADYIKKNRLYLSSEAGNHL